MSFQAYLDTIETKTGKTPSELIELAHKKGFTTTSKASEFVAWLKDDYQLGRGHAMALFHVLKNGATISSKHVGSSSVHADESTTLRLDGIAKRQD